jgi:micrococcal nuclease
MKKLIILLLLILTACQFNTNNYPKGIKAQVNKVFSGQSIEVIINDSLVKVRLMGINAPDLKQSPWGKQAKNKLQELLITKNSLPLTSKSIILETDLNQKDDYGRIQAYIWKNNLFVNEELVAQGYAIADLIYTDDNYSKRLGYAQEYARIMGYGLWNPKQPMRLSPQEFRQQNKLN